LHRPGLEFGGFGPLPPRAAGELALADALHVSGPIAVVAAGLLIGNHGRSSAMSATAAGHLDLFWELIDEILNAVLFVLLGFEVLVLTFTGAYLAAGLLTIPVVLLARLASVGLPVWALRRWQQFGPGTVGVLTWGGLRGGISVAMALYLPVEVGGQPVPGREPLLVVTYVVVVFSILVQGLTIGPLTRRWLAQGHHTPRAAHGPAEGQTRQTRFQTPGRRARSCHLAGRLGGARVAGPAGPGRPLPPQPGRL
jgi:CPA1 family monovalent cation:H+ antiporter